MREACRLKPSRVTVQPTTVLCTKFVEFDLINWDQHGSSTTFESGLGKVSFLHEMKEKQHWRHLKKRKLWHCGLSWCRDISSRRLSTINRFLPSTEEAEMYKNYKDDPSTLVPEDQFMMKVKWQKWLPSNGLYIPWRKEYFRNELVPIFVILMAPIVILFHFIRFVYQLCEIKDLEKRLDLLLVVMEFPGQFEDLAPVSWNATSRLWVVCWNYSGIPI